MSPDRGEPARASDQLPEDAPAEVASGGPGEGASRESAQDLAKGANRSGSDPGDGRDAPAERRRAEGAPKRRTPKGR